MKVLVACEFSGIVRDAFIDKGHDAWSCDILPTERPGNHIQDDVLKHLDDGWDMMIAHPPCTYLAISGNRWMINNPERIKLREKAVKLFMAISNSTIPMMCIENPVGIMSTRWRKPDQYIQPYEFGHPETKKTGLWLKGLPKLKPTNTVQPEYIISKNGNKYSPIHWNNPSNRGHERSRTFQGIANAMAEQWG